MAWPLPNLNSLDIDWKSFEECISRCGVWKATIRHKEFSMQVVVQIICSKGSSLRQAIVGDRRLSDYGLVVSEEKRLSRPNGWAKIHSSLEGRYGALNIVWHGPTNVLLCRVVTRGPGKPDLVVGDFVGYLLSRYRKRIQSINIVRR